MNTLLKTALFLFSFIVLFSSCRVEKRVYRKGYHVVWNHHRAGKEKAEPQAPQTVDIAQKKDIPETVVVTANIEKEVLPISVLKKPEFRLGGDTCGDVLLFKNGDKLLAKVIEVTNDNIKYKRCDNLDGPLFVVHKRSLALLTYYNGVKEDLTVPDEVKPQVKAYQQQRVTNTLGLVSFILAMIACGIGVTAPLGIIAGIGSLRQFKAEPKRYKHKWMPMVAVITGLAMSVAFGLIFLLLYFSYGELLWVVIVCAISALIALYGLVTAT